MEFLSHLWLPIVVSGAAVWVASCLAWMVVGHHKKDWKQIPSEGAFIDAVKQLGIGPGSYGFPEFRACEGLSQEQKKAKWEEMQENPMGLLRVWGPIRMGRSMVLTLLVYVVASVLIAYLAWNALPHAGGGGFGTVMRVVGTAGVLTYCIASLPNDIWFQRSLREVVTSLIDGVMLGLITGAVFGWLWPA
jgi:hypothetical protein